MVAEGVARLFEKNLPAAQAAFDLADHWITARNTEVARRWYLLGSGIVPLLAAVARGYDFWEGQGWSFSRRTGQNNHPILLAR